MSEIEDLRRQLADVETRLGAALTENAAIRLRACDAHEAVWRAMRDTPEAVVAAVQDDGYLHAAIHRVLAGPDGTAQARWDAAARDHIEALGERVIRAELEALSLRQNLNTKRARRSKLRRRSSASSRRCRRSGRGARTASS